MGACVCVCCDGLMIDVDCIVSICSTLQSSSILGALDITIAEDPKPRSRPANGHLVAHTLLDFLLASTPQPHMPAHAFSCQFCWLGRASDRSRSDDISGRCNEDSRTAEITTRCHSSLFASSFGTRQTLAGYVLRPNTTRPSMERIDCY